MTNIHWLHSLFGKRTTQRDTSRRQPRTRPLSRIELLEDRLAPALIGYWNFDEASSGTAAAVNQVGGGTNGTFAGGATRTTGLIGVGAALFTDASAEQIAVGATGYTFPTAISIDAYISSTWTGAGYDEIFRKNGTGLILFSFQSDPNNGGAVPPVAAGPVLSFGLTIAGVYNELDMPLDGASGRPTLAEMTDATPDHVIATYDSATGVKAIYVNGTLRMSHNYTVGSLITNPNTTTVATIGNSGTGGGEPFRGVIDEVAISSDATSAAQAAARYANLQAGVGLFTPSPTPVVNLPAGGGNYVLAVNAGFVELTNNSVLVFRQNATGMTSLTINRGAATDTLTTTTMTGYTGSLTFGGAGAPFSLVTVAGPTSLGAGSNYVVHATAANFSSASATVTLSGAGAATMNVGTLTSAAGAGVTTASGNISFPSPLTISGGYSQIVQSSDPVAYYRLGESSLASSAVNSAIGASSAGAAANAAYGSPGVSVGQTPLIIGDANTAASVTQGQTGAITSGSFDKYTGGTGSAAEAWIRVTSTALAGSGFLNVVGDNLASFMIYIGFLSSTKFFLRAHLVTAGGTGAGLTAIDTGLLDVGQTYHVVANWDKTASSNAFTLYVNGAVAAQFAGAKTGNASNASAAVYIGKDPREGANHSAVFDEVALYKRPLTPAEITQHYTAGSVGVTNTATLTTASGTIAFGGAVSGNGTFIVANNTGTLTTAAAFGSRLTLATGPASVKFTGPITLGSAAIINADIAGNAANSAYDTFTGTGNIDLAGATLNLNTTYVPTASDTFTLLTTTGTITGSFANFPPNAIVSVNGVNKQAIYTATSFSLVPVATPLNGTAASDTFEVYKDASNNVVVLLGGTPILTQPLASTTSLLINGLAGNDTLNIDYSNVAPATGFFALPIGFDGGADTDAMTVTGGSFATAVLAESGPTSGALSLNGNSLSFTANESLTTTGAAAATTVTLPSSASQAVLQSAGGGNWRLSSSNATFGNFTFANPASAASLSINRGNAADVITTNDLTGFVGSLTLGAVGNPLGTVTLAGPFAPAAGSNLIARGTTITFSAATSDVTLTGAGAATFDASTIHAAVGATVTTASGNVSFPSSVSFGASYSQLIVASDPVAYYRFGEASTANPAVNSATGPSSAAAAANGTYGSPGVQLPVSTLVVDDTTSAVGVTQGQNGSISTPGYDKYTGGTGSAAEAWVRVTSSTLVGTGFLNVVGDNLASFMLYVGFSSSTKFFFRAHLVTSGGTNAGITAIDSGLFDVGQTYHVVANWDRTAASNAFTLYVNGAVAAQFAGAKTGNASSLASPVYIGKDPREGANHSAVFDEVALYKRPLSPAEITQHYTVGAGTSLAANLAVSTASGNIVFGGNTSGPGTVNLASATGAANFAGTVGNTVALATGPSLLNSSAVTFASTARVLVDIAGNTAGVTYDQLRATGNIQLGGATLVINATYTPSGADSFTIVQTTGALSGVFANVPDGSSITIGSRPYRAIYSANALTFVPDSNPTVSGTASANAIEIRRVASGNIQVLVDSVIVLDSAFASLTGLVVNGLGGNDTINVNYSTVAPATGFFTLPITINGGAGTDFLTVTGGTFATAIASYTNATDGTFNLAGNVITFAGIEPAAWTGTTTNVTINLPNIASQLALESPAGTTTLRGLHGGFTSLAFSSPGASGSLSIVGGNLADTLSVVAHTPGVVGALSLSGGGGTDVVALNVPMNLGSLDVTAEDIRVNRGASIIAGTGSVAFNGPVTLGGYADAIRNADPVAYYRLGEANTATQVVNLANGPSSAGAAANGAYANAGITPGQPGLVATDPSTAVGLASGSTGRVATGSFEKFAGGTGFSTEFWVNLSTAPSGFTNLVGDGIGSGNFNMMIYAGALSGSQYFIRPHLATTAAFNAVDSIALNINTTYHVVATWTAATGQIRLYINGAQVGAATFAGTNPTIGSPINTANQIFVGVDNRTGTNNATSVIDEVALYRRPLSPTEIAAHYALGSAPSGDIISITTSNANITFSSTVTAADPGRSSLTMFAGTGDITLAGAVGATRLGSFSITGARNVSAAAISASTISQSSGAGTSTFAGTLDASGAGGISLAGSAFFITGNMNATAGPISIAHTGASSLSTGAGTIVSTGLTVSPATAATGSIAAAVSGPGGLTKSGAGSLSLTGTMTYAGTTTVNQGTLFVNTALPDNAAAIDVIVAAAGTLAGTGPISGVTQIAGAAAPGNSPGTLAVAATNFVAGSVFNVEIAGALFDQLAVSGSVTLGGARLVIDPAATPLSGSHAPYIIIDNDGTLDPIGGVFTSDGVTPLNQGALVGIFGGVPLYISYIGGDGNDVELLTSVDTINGSPGDDTLVVRQRDASNIEFSYNGARFVPFTSSMLLTFNGLGGNDLMLIDLAPSTPFSGQLMFDGEAIRVQGAGGTASYTPQGVNQIVAASGFLNYAGSPTIDFVGLANASIVTTTGAFTLQNGATTTVAGAGAYSAASQAALNAVGGGASVQFVGNTLSRITTGSGAGDTITVAAAGAAISGPLELTASTIGGSGVLTGTSLDLRAVGDITLATNIASLTAHTTDAAGDISITEANAITLVSVTTSGGSVAVSAGGDIGVGRVVAEDSTVSLQVTSANGSILDADNDGAADVEAVFGITLIARGTGTIGAAGNALELGSDGAGVIDALIARTDNQNIVLAVPVGDVRVRTLNSVTGGGAIPAGSSGNITLTTAGNVFMDSDAFGGGADIVGNLVTFIAAGDLGTNLEPLEMNAITLIANTAAALPSGGAQFLAEADSVAIGMNGLNPGSSSANLEKLGAGPAIYTFSSGNSINDLARLNLADDVRVVLSSAETLGALGDYPGHVASPEFAEIQFAGVVLTVGANGADTSYSGILTGAGGQFVKLGVGRFTEIDGGANSYTGLTTVENGALVLAKTGAGNLAIVGPIQIGDTVGVVGSAVLEIAASEQIADAASIAFTGLDGRLLSTAGATETITTPTAFAQGDVKIAGLLITTNAYAQLTGSTTLHGGTLRVGPLGTLPYTLGTSSLAGGVLQGSGTIYTNVLTSYGTIDPSSGATDADVGNASAGRITIRGNLQLTGSSITNLDVSSAGSDQLNVGINTALPLPAGSYSVLSNYELDPYLRGDVASVTETVRRGINNVANINGTVRFAGELNTRPIVGSTLANNASYGNSMNFVWRALNLAEGNLDPKTGNLSSVPSDFATKNSRDVNGLLLTSSGTRFDMRFVGSGGQFNAVGQSVGMMTKFGSVDTAILTAPAYAVGQAKALTLTSLSGEAAVDTVVKISKQTWNAMKDSHSRVTLTIGNPSGSAVSGPFYVEVLNLPAGATVFNAAGKRPTTGKPYLVVPASSLAAGASITMEVDLLTPMALGKTATLSLQVLRGGMP